MFGATLVCCSVIGFFSFTPFVFTGILLSLINASLLLPYAMHEKEKMKQAAALQPLSHVLLQVSETQIPPWAFRMMGCFCLIYAILGFTTGQLWSRYRVVSRKENPVFFHFLLLAQFLFGLWFYFR